MKPSDLLISWTIRFSMLLLFAVYALQIQRQSGLSMRRLPKYLWTGGFVICALHVLAAFQFVHGWSHSAAYLATAEDTRKKLGIAYGAGVYFNYLFLAVWGADVCWTWRSHKNLSSSTPWIIRAGRWFMLFIAFNSVVVFKSGWLRLIGAIATLALLGIAIRNRRSRSTKVEEHKVMHSDQSPKF